MDVPLVLIDSVFLENTNLYGDHFSSSRREVAFWEVAGSFLTNLFTLAMSDLGETPYAPLQGNDQPHDELLVDTRHNFLKRVLVGCITQLYSGKAVNERRIHNWCLYFAVMAEKSLNLRLAFAPPTQRKTLVYEEELNLLVSCLHDVLSCSNLAIPVPYICDLIDSAVLDTIVGRETHCVTPIVTATYQEFLEELNLSESNEFSLNSVETLTFDCDDDKEALLFPPLTGKVITAFTGDLLQTFKGVDQSALEADGTAYTEKFHWHALKELRDVDERMDTPKLMNLKHKASAMRNTQKYNDFMRNYGLKLNGNEEPKIIITQKFTTKAKPVKAEREGESSKQSKSAKKQKAPSKKEQIIAQNKSAKQAEESKKFKERWQFIQENLDKKGTEEKLEELNKITAADENVEHPEPHEMLLSILFEQWKDKKNFGDAAALVSKLQMYARKADLVKLKTSFLMSVTKYFLRLGFVDVGEVLRRNHFPGKSLPEIKKPCHVGLTYVEFQLLHMGHLMPRNVRSDRDPRVEGFIPDTWQRKLLDTIDRNQSALIVAPTSSGKTFCSYYCIEKVLKESDDGVVVYVAPTKALVNQVSATIYGKYTKNLKDGQSLTGTFTRDYKQNAENCQVLITVPQCLELLLLSPKRQAWVKSIRYVILDEVHCLGGEMGGEVWEHILAMIRCPFLALSATIGDPSSFHGWLKSIAEFKHEHDQEISPVVNVVIYDERYSDLNMSVFHEKDNKLHSVHPCGFLDPNLLAKKGFPKNMKLSALETNSLLSAALKTLEGDDLVAVNQLEPGKIFQAAQPINKIDARNHEVQVKQTLESIFRDKSPQESMAITTNLIREVMIEGEREKPHDCSPENSYKPLRLESKEFRLLFPALMEQLRKEQKLPVIVFRCDRSDIENLADGLMKSIVTEMKKDRELQSLLQRKKRLEDKLLQMSKATRDLTPTKEGADDHSDVNIGEEHGKCCLLIEEKLSKYLLMEPGHDDSIKQVIGKASERMRTLMSFGIGYHHAGCNINDRRAVEMLFRMGKIQVVIATSTLALGIHMPCKSVVFVGEDYYVDALAFRQMAGRSGRRGFDNIGHAVFFGVPHGKISRLLEANITKLKGRHPLSLSFVLRLFLLMSGAKDKDDAKLRILSALENSFLSHGSPTVYDQVRYYFLFSCHLLFQQRLIRLDGTPLGYAGLMTHLHYHEPGNLIFAGLLGGGALQPLCFPSSTLSSHDNYERYGCRQCHVILLTKKHYRCGLCSTYGRWEYVLCNSCFGAHTCHDHKKRTFDYKRKNAHDKSDFLAEEPWLKQLFTEDSLRSLVEVLCHLFCHKRIPKSWLRQDDEATLAVQPTCGSKVILPTMPEDISASVSDMNQQTLDTFLNFLRCVTHGKPQELQLPLSRCDVFSEPLAQREHQAGISVISRLSGSENRSILSPDLPREDFERLLPLGMNLTSELLPCLDTIVLKNSYALDFFKHGSSSALFIDNGLKSGEIYDLLNDFFLTIRTISTALEQIPEQELMSNAFKHLSVVFETRFRKVVPGIKTNTI